MIKRYITAVAVFILAGLLLVITVEMKPQAQIRIQQPETIMLFK